MVSKLAPAGGVQNYVPREASAIQS